MEEHAVLVLKNSSNEILFVKRSMQKKILPGAWAFPSGTLEKEEDIYDTIKREAKEEIGIEVNPLKILSQAELPEFSVKLCFVLCEIKKGIPRINEPKEIEKIEWMTFNDFFKRFSDNEIGHGLVWLRKNSQIWRDL